MKRTYLTNATLILPNETVSGGTLLIEDGLIADICPVAPQHIAEFVNLHGEVLLPGLIDLHSDAIEREMEPRPRANLPMPHAVLQGDRKCALAGITTAFHAIGFHGEQWNRNSDTMAKLARTIRQRSELSCVDNRIHCRFELNVLSGIPYIEALIEEGICTLVALNNHIPGQGQYGEAVYRKRLLEEGVKSDEEIARIIAEKQELAQEAEKNAPAMAEIAVRHNIPLASHDDDSPEKIETRWAQGATISEFPLNFETARRAKERGMHAIVGSPNVLRGGSTGGGVKAIDLVAEDLADCLCSDYAPSTLLPALFYIAQELSWPLHRVVPIGTIGPAKAARLADRGAILPGLRADLIAVRAFEGAYGVQHLWSAGRHTLLFPDA